VLPVIRALAKAGAVVSIDTMRASTAEAALHAGARIINDVSGGLADADLPRVAAAAGVPYVVMHWRGHSAQMQQQAVYADVVREVRDELAARHGLVLELVHDQEIGLEVEHARGRGIEREEVRLRRGRVHDLVGDLELAEDGAADLARLDAQVKLHQAVGALEDAVQRPLTLPQAIFESGSTEQKSP